LGEVFGTNPLTLLDVSDDDWLILFSCARVISNDREQQRAEMEKRK
jgi:hypothetical protein